MYIQGFNLTLLFNVFIELISGYAVLFVISHLILIPGKNKLMNVNDKNGYKIKKEEIRRVRRYICLIWTFIIIVINALLFLI